MDHISYSSFRRCLASSLDKVNDDRAPLLVTRQNGKAAVVMSLEGFQSYEETAYLMASQTNAVRLQQAIGDIESGRAIDRELIDE